MRIGPFGHDEVVERRTGTETIQEERTDVRVDEGDHDRFSHYVEKAKLAVGFLPITCAVPLIYGERLGSYSKEGLDVSLQKIAGIALGAGGDKVPAVERMTHRSMTSQ